MLTELRFGGVYAPKSKLRGVLSQTVFGEGPGTAEIMLVGEQPGDREDVEGHPFVGSAGRVLAQALEEAGIDSDRPM